MSRNRPNASRRAKTENARRATVLNLLARLDRGELTPDERAALRQAVTADHAALDTARQAQREHGTAMRRQAAQLNAAHEAIEEAEREHGRAEIRAATAEHQAALLAEELRPHRAAAAQDCAARVRAFLAEQTAHLTGTELGRMSVAAHIAQHFPTTAPEVCCDCGSPKVAYHNYREQPFCWPCADGQPAPTTSTPEPRP